MILNINISGKETPEQISKMAMETMETIQEDLTPSNAAVAMRVMDFHLCLGISLVSTSHINMAMNEAKGDMKAANEIMKRYRNNLDNTLVGFTDALLKQIDDSRATMTVHK